ncbi:hypothetical protein K458DRAFT_24064 [Lentithecium fluviatile CBS 122367]|uniref:Uncharacterized protein n=1 Tax=Lentithecium fluviatile CBS 122367 TaxID=1168545 RepID=A0A6G1J5J6_9PLEO|nr:hypothetical protein K458DRAFT_24064 [Lentithecium fluviatile CBS 122367]
MAAASPRLILSSFPVPGSHYAPPSMHRLTLTLATVLLAYFGHRTTETQGFRRESVNKLGETITTPNTEMQDRRDPCAARKPWQGHFRTIFSFFAKFIYRNAHTPTIAMTRE